MNRSGALLASILYKEHVSLVSWGGIVVSVLGVALISVKPGRGVEVSLSVLIVLAAALAQAVYSVAQKSLLQRYSPITLTSYAIWAGTLFLLIFLPTLLKEGQRASFAATGAAVYMGIVPGALGYVSWSYVVSKVPASQAGSFLSLVPAVAIAIAWVWLGEIPQLAALVGGLLIVVGVVAVNTQRHQQQRESGAVGR